MKNLTRRSKKLEKKMFLKKNAICQKKMLSKPVKTVNSEFALKNCKNKEKKKKESLTNFRPHLHQLLSQEGPLKS